MTAPSSPRKKFIFDASDVQVRGYLKGSFEKIYPELKKIPEVKPHLKRFTDSFDNVPPFWKEEPIRASILLKTYGSELHENQKKTLHEISEGAEKIDEKLEEKGKPRPTIIRVLRLLDDFANNPDTLPPDLEDRLCKINNRIYKNTLSPEQRKELERDEKKAKKEEEKDRKAKRHSLKLETQPHDEKKERRLSFDPKLLGPVKVDPASVKNNPKFAVFGFYKQRALLNDWDTAAFDKTLESKVLPRFSKLKGLPIDSMREELRKLFNQRQGSNSIHVGVLAADPHHLLEKNEEGSSYLPADPFQIIPTLMRMVVRAALEATPKDTRIPVAGKDFGFPIAAASRYLDTSAFEEDYKQLQAALNLKETVILKRDVPDNANLVSPEEVKKTLSSPQRKRKALEKQKGDIDADNLSEAGSPYKSKSPKPKKSETTTTTTTATTTTTTISIAGSPVKSTTHKGLVRLSSASETDDMSPQLKPTFELVMGQLNSLYEKFGVHLGSGTMKLLIVLKELFEKSTEGEPDLAQMLPLAIEIAQLSDREVTILKDVGIELGKKAQILGRSESALKVANFLVNVGKCLSAQYEKVND